MPRSLHATDTSNPHLALCKAFKKQLEQSLYDVDLLKDPQCLPTALRVKVKDPQEPSRYEVTEP